MMLFDTPERRRGRIVRSVINSLALLGLTTCQGRGLRGIGLVIRGYVDVPYYWAGTSSLISAVRLSDVTNRDSSHDN